MTETQITLERISKACSEIQQTLNDQLHSTTNAQYKQDIEKDLVLLNNLKHIVIAVNSDIDSDTIGSCTELILRIAANDFKNRLNNIPDKKAKCREIMQDLKFIHNNILHRKSTRK